LNNLSNRLTEMSRWKDSLTVIQEGVDVYRDLATTNAAVYLPKLAGALNNMSIKLGPLCRPYHALIASEEAVEISRSGLASGVNSAAYLPTVAAGLNNVSMWLGMSGHRDEALAAVTEYVDIYHRLAETNPSIYLPILVGALNHLSRRLDEVGRHDDAAATRAEAEELRTQVRT
jgi:hypothetical protein